MHYNDYVHVSKGSVLISSKINLMSLCIVYNQPPYLYIFIKLNICLSVYLSVSLFVVSVCDSLKNR